MVRVLSTAATEVVKTMKGTMEVSTMGGKKSQCKEEKIT